MSNRADPPGDDPDDLTGQVLDGRYKVLEPLGVGGMGTVYRGEHLMLETPVAIKVLQPQYAYDPEWVKRFLLEARAASRVRHPHIVQMLDFAAPRRGLVYMVMELLEGENLARLSQREGPLLWPRAVHIVAQVADALTAAHALGIIHRDIKPANCFRATGHGDPDFTKVLDFGIAKLVAGDTTDTEAPRTATGHIMGTPEYMAPEVLLGSRPDARADVYSVGVLLYKLLTGATPFSGNHVAIAQQFLQRAPAPPSASAPAMAIPPAVDELVMAALRREPEARIAAMSDLRDALRALANDAATTSAPHRTADGSPSRSAELEAQTLERVRTPAVPVAADKQLAGSADNPPTPATSQLRPAPAPEPATSTHHAARRTSPRTLLSLAVIPACLLALLVWIASSRREEPIGAPVPEAPARTEEPPATANEPPPPSLDLPPPSPPSAPDPAVESDSAPTVAPAAPAINPVDPRERQLRARLTQIGRIGAKEKRLIPCLPKTTLVGDGVHDEVPLVVTVDASGATRVRIPAQGGGPRRLPASQHDCVKSVLEAERFPPGPRTLEIRHTLRID